MVSNYDRQKLHIGVKQVFRALQQSAVDKLWIAKDAQDQVTRNIAKLALEKGVCIEYVDTMKELGRLCQIDVGAAAAVIIK